MFSKKVVSLVYLEKFTIASPWIKFSDDRVHKVWVIMDSWWTIMLWSGSTKIWCNRFRKQFRWLALKYFFGLHIKSLIALKIFGATFGIEGGSCLHCPPPGYAPGTLLCKLSLVSCLKSLINIYRYLRKTAWTQKQTQVQWYLLRRVRS